MRCAVMETESESIDISSIKLAALAPIEINEQGFLEPIGHARHIDRVQAAVQHLIKQTHNAWQDRTQDMTSLPLQHHTESGLPSTVPESQDLARVASLGKNLQFHDSHSPSRSQNMSAHSTHADATQEISPEYYDILIQKSLIEDAERIRPLDKKTETQLTLNEGDEGHVDLTSSLVQHASDEEFEDGFLPTQSQHRLSQYPESQRFKTPATIGRKRDYTGRMIESPSLPRNPLLRNDAPTPKQVMGLSQAFAATQAGSSPFPEAPTTISRSDRPSPNIELQARPITATASSPLRPISEFRRATTEPASKYIPLKQSQVEREQRARQKAQEQLHHESSDDDDFDEVPSAVRRERIRRERQQLANEQLRLLSSPSKRLPRGKDAMRSSPIPGPPSSSPRFLSEKPISSDMDAGMVAILGGQLHEDTDHESEAETEEEDEDTIMNECAEQRRGLDEEDKENFRTSAIQIPQTTARLHRIVNAIPSEVEASPSLRHATAPIIEDTSSWDNLDAFAIANSQPSQPIPTSQLKKLVPRSTDSSAVIEIIPQSQEEAMAARSKPHSPAPATIKEKERDDELQSHENFTSLPHGCMAVDNLDSTMHQNESSPATATRKSTIPESSSAQQRTKGSITKASTSRKATSTFRSSSDAKFETAQAHLPHKGGSQIELSSPPIMTTPPGRKRKRMAEIAEEPSPQQSSLGFDASQALRIDPDIEGLLSQSPVRPGLRKSKRPKFNPQDFQSDRVQAPARVVEHPGEAADESHMKSTSLADMSSDDEADQAIITSQSEFRSRYSASISRNRQSTWDLDMSPPQKSVPIMRSDLSVKRTKAVKGSLIQPKSSPATPPSTQSSTHEPLHPDEGRSSPVDGALAINTALQAEPQETRAEPQETRAEPVAPNMVFACFNGKTRAYYPARCLGIVDGVENRYQIQWDGYAPDEIDAYGIKSLEIRIGDLVKVDMVGFPKVSHIVRGFKHQQDQAGMQKCLTDVYGNKTLLVAAKQRKSLPADVSTEAIKEVPVAAIYLDTNMWNQMKDRKFEYQAQLTQPVSITGYVTPMERPSTPSTPSSRNRRQQAATQPNAEVTISNGLFHNMAFAISYEDATRKRILTDTIVSNGGRIIAESFLSLVETDSIEITSQYTNMGFTALLADRHSRKEKYMQALALGLPCLGGRWIEACVTENTIIDWKNYLLPAGECDELEGATKSRVMTSTNSNSNLTDMIEARPLMLQDQKVIIVMGRGKAEVKRKPYLFLIQTLGPSRIEKVIDLKTAHDLVKSEAGLFDWIFVDDRDVDSMKSLIPVGKAKAMKKQCRVAGNELIVQSLILGRLAMH